MSPKTAVKKPKAAKKKPSKTVVSKIPAKKPAARKAAKQAVRPIPEGYQQVIPYLVVNGAATVIEFLEKTFGGKSNECMKKPDGTIMHGEVRIGDSVVMLGEASEKWPARPANVYVYCKDVDAAYQRALAAGATSLSEPVDQFYGDRSCGVADSAGNTWWIGTRVENVSKEEMERRAAAYAPNC